MTQFPTVDRELYRTGTVEPINSAGMWPRLVDTDGRFLPTDGIRLAFWEELWPTQDDYNWQPYRSLPERDRKNDGRRLAFFVNYGPLLWGPRQRESKQRRPRKWNSVGRRSSEEIDVLGIWTTDMASLIEEDIREHYERRTVEWRQWMRGTLQTDIPALNDTFCGQLMPFPEDSSGGANNDSHNGLPFGCENEMQEEALQGNRAGAANSIVIGDVWTPLSVDHPSHPGKTKLRRTTSQNR
jgi:hypothetical protein